MTSTETSTIFKTESHIVDIDDDDDDDEPKQLRSILKTTRNDSEEESTIYQIKIIISILFLIFLAPFIVCDLYYGYTDSSCIQLYPKNLNINMKTYLIVSGYSEIVILIIGVCGISSISIQNIHTHIIILNTVILRLFSLFSIIWNIIGSIVFWGTVYNAHDCDKNISTYIFVTLIVKMISNLSHLSQLNKNNKDTVSVR